MRYLEKTRLHQDNVGGRQFHLCVPRTLAFSPISAKIMVTAVCGQGRGKPPSAYPVTDDAAIETIVVRLKAVVI